MKIQFALVILGIILAIPVHGEEYINGTDGNNIDRDNMESSNMDTEMDTGDMDTSNRDTEMDTGDMDASNIDY